MPDERERVVEDVRGVGPRVASIHHVGPIALSHLYLHKLGQGFYLIRLWPFFYLQAII